MLGAFADVAFEHAEAMLVGREALVLYTDGLTEARGDGDFFGEERLFDCCREAGEKA